MTKLAAPLSQRPHAATMRALRRFLHHGAPSQIDWWAWRKTMFTQADILAPLKDGRACVYYMTAERMQRQGFGPRHKAYAMMLDCMRRFIELGRENCSRVEIPYDGSSFPGLLVRVKPVVRLRAWSSSTGSIASRKWSIGAVSRRPSASGAYRRSSSTSRAPGGAAPPRSDGNSERGEMGLAGSRCPGGARRRRSRETRNHGLVVGWLLRAAGCCI